MLSQSVEGLIFGGTEDFRHTVGISAAPAFIVAGIPIEFPEQGSSLLVRNREGSFGKGDMNRELRRLDDHLMLVLSQGKIPRCTWLHEPCRLHYRGPAFQRGRHHMDDLRAADDQSQCVSV